MQLIGYSPPQVDLDAIPGLRRVYTWTSASVQQTTRRVVALTTLIDRAGSLLDDVAELRRSAEIIAGSLSKLGASAAGIDQNAREIADEIAGLSNAAQGIDTHAEKLATGIDELVGSCRPCSGSPRSSTRSTTPSSDSAGSSTGYRVADHQRPPQP